MNRVPLARRVQIINCLVEGNSIRSTERMTGTHRDTICRLLVEVGDGCAKLMDEQMRELPCRRIEVDEIWSYVGKKQRHMTPLDDRAALVINTPSLRSIPRRRLSRHIASEGAIFRPRPHLSPIWPIGWQTGCSYRRMPLRPTLRLSNGLLAQMSITAKRLNFTRQNPRAAVATARRTSPLPSVL
jgi:hypothetical protein